MRKLIVVLIISFFCYPILTAQSHRDSIDVLHYDLHVEVPNTSNAYINGVAHITCTMVFSGSTLGFDLYKMNVDSVKIDDAMLPFETNDTLVRIFSDFNENDTLIFSVYYNGSPKKDSRWGGFYFQQGFAYNIGVGMASYPHGIGRFWYPCIDSFTDRASYDYYLKTPLNKKGVGGGVLVDEYIENEFRIAHWSLTQDIPTYLSSIAVGSFIQFDSVYQGINEVDLQLFSSMNDSNGMVSTFNQIMETTHAFEHRFGPYRWDRIGFVAVPFNMGAMEHATNIAFPSNALSGSLSNKTLAAHELSHHWFGNLVTCASSYEMWLNEGWASYCEIIFKEEVISKEAAQLQVESNHNQVLKSAHLSDGGYFPLNNLPPAITYGKHAYNKGADVVHTLRNYMGDSLFFEGVNHYLNKFANKHANSQDLCDALSESSGEDMQAFFNNWVYQPGFPHYSIASFSHVKENNEVRLIMQQKLRARERYSDKNRIEVTFANKEWEFVSEKIEFNGKKDTIQLQLPIKPDAVFIDLDKKYADATIDQYAVVNKPGYERFNNCDFTLNVSSITDSAFIQVVHNYTVAEGCLDLSSGLHLSNCYYWTMHGLIPDVFEAEGNFFYNLSANSDSGDGYEPSATDTVVMLYRLNADECWQLVKIGASAKINFGELNNVPLKMGEYAIAFWDGTPLNILQKQSDDNTLRVYPTPTKNRCKIEFSTIYSGTLTVYDNYGGIVLDTSCSNVSNVFIKTENWTSGVYIVKLNGSQHGVCRIVKD